VVDEEHDVVDALCVTRHVDVLVQLVVAALDTKEVVLDVDAGLRELEQVLALKDCSIDVRHDGFREISAGISALHARSTSTLVLSHTSKRERAGVIDT